ncbi:hypothetical protein R2G56_18960 [Nitratireductor aquimarinus]|uniref:REJ domain-containing protein n=1 Tax=Nitratireductor aquimarinus TaxID=889300 RepID=A0ABU4AQ46_9HYPH|nr:MULTISPECIES: hypothetical protein [Alphaproteobacteria]MBY6022500.1 hypothetical protein [Nitratireductor sp. DP7N14-4]MBN7757709.1 hypothetical protein [Nitratireductor aquimarinus]MBN7778103.1 hypothetical protein [Nitratireductor pacificus]MBN7782425.1 hypothetical protein [Nitratireductor pacificus]MBN7791232.1 hypothetical protein [Nitratireductor aquimarinus]
MVSGEFGDTERAGWSTRAGNVGIGALRIALLFGTAAVALALFLTPVVEKSTRSKIAQVGAPFGIDPITTSSTKRQDRSYTIRRSVLQPSRNATCIIHQDGRRSGDC